MQERIGPVWDVDLAMGMYWPAVLSSKGPLHGSTMLPDDVVWSKTPSSKKKQRAVVGCPSSSDYSRFRLSGLGAYLWAKWGQPWSLSLPPASFPADLCCCCFFFFFLLPSSFLFSGSQAKGWQAGACMSGVSGSTATQGAPLQLD